MMSLCTALKAGPKDGMKVNGDSTVMSSMSKTYVQFKIYFLFFLSFFLFFFAAETVYHFTINQK